MPDSNERVALLLTGLGEKKITLDEYCTAEEIRTELLFQYPKLSAGGGFDLLRVSEGVGKSCRKLWCPKMDI